MSELGYHAVNIGERDVRYGYELLSNRTAGSDLRFISANIVDKQTQQPIFTPHAVVEIESPDGANSARVGVIGAARFNPVFLQPGPEGKEMVIVHPKQRVEQELAALRDKKVDLVVLLAAMHRDDARRLARDLIGIDFVVGAYGGVFTTERDQEGETWILYSGNQGKRIGETRVFLDENLRVTDQSTKIHLMTALYPSDPAMLKFVNAVPIPTGPQPSGGKAVAGPASAGSPGGREPR
jgi:2',3'-cyclic-nucleotide 2'-phosphodiesterase (5'-nucleotidase family)